MEVWKDFWFTSDYQVSNLGAVRSKDRWVKAGKKSGKRLAKGQAIKPFVAQKTGYLQVMVKRKKYSVHRLVAMAFCGGYEAGLVVNHINGNKKDNRAANLEWVTHGENQKHAYQTLGIVHSATGRKRGESNKARPVVKMLNGKVLKVYDSGMSAVDDGFESAGISHCCRGRYATHKGFEWAYLEDVKDAS